MRTSGAVRQPGAYGGQQPGAYGGQQPGAYGVQQLGAYSGQLPGTRPGQPPATGPQRPQAPAQPGRVASSGAAGVQEGPPPATGAQPSVSHASVFFGKAVPPATLEGLLGAHSLEALGPAPAPLPRLATPLSAAVNALLNEVCRQRGRLLRTRVLPAGEAGELAFFSALVEDKAGSAGGSYADCLRQLHRAIVNKLS
ncbi:hypothetical protein APUTEX25_004314 [Auxenochlorella protothecoides]|uniref:Uncharacterized protein n=1 Tax=Auxenochlorella protothecoides TaxID=3075 RepID=A0A3M7L695_AUXPR|nr:hypothetical protein APUTEX25_004314 [Auxenochlorella protothecoides]|eukprot:RMZ57480.1 hypothetical protein APUTEX25_004314 [Auxenochlorella protothecoides]